jgi:2-acylglycerol O-acyltransferase 2
MTSVLNGEPSQPRGREEKNLPPNSHAGASIETLSDGDSFYEAPLHYEGQGEDRTAQTPRRNRHRRSGAARAGGENGDGSREDDDNDDDDDDDDDDDYSAGRTQDERAGRPTTIPRPDFEESMRQSRREERRRSNGGIGGGGGGGDLASGRIPGARWERSSIRFAPLNVPLKRRLQTLVVLLHSLFIVLCLSAFFSLCAIPLFWPLLLPYILHLLFSDAGTSGTLSRRSERLRRLPIWSLFASYFPARLHRSEPLPATRKYIFGYHPHGIISHGAWSAFATDALGFSQLFPGITNTLLTLDSNFRIPLYRDYALAMGLASVSLESCLNLLSRGGANGEGMGRAITIVVGGARESLDAQPGTLRLVLRRRKGFVKLAIRAGADLVPVLGFGENELYDQVRQETHPGIHRAQLIVKRLMGFTIPLFHARGVFNYDAGMMPYRRPLNVVVGRPIKVVQQRNPDAAYVDEIHALYVAELERIWRERKGEFSPDMKGDLEIIE